MAAADLVLESHFTGEARRMTSWWVDITFPILSLKMFCQLVQYYPYVMQYYPYVMQTFDEDYQGVNNLTWVTR